MENKPKCPKCSMEMIRIPGFYALTEVKKEGTNVSFIPTSGIPIVTLMCFKCGYIENYSAMILGEWEKI